MPEYARDVYASWATLTATRITILRHPVTLACAAIVPILAMTYE
jgi:hypothetical protein